MSQHPEMSRQRIKRLLKESAQSPEYWSTLTAGAPRIDLEGNVAGKVTAADEEDAKPKIANEARRLRTARRNPQRLRIYRPARLQPRSNRQHHVRGWPASRRPHKLAGGGSSPRSAPGPMAA